MKIISRSQYKTLCRMKDKYNAPESFFLLNLEKIQKIYLKQNKLRFIYYCFILKKRENKIFLVPKLKIIGRKKNLPKKMLDKMKKKKKKKRKWNQLMMLWRKKNTNRNDECLNNNDSTKTIENIDEKLREQLNLLMMGKPKTNINNEIIDSQLIINTSTPSSPPPLSTTPEPLPSTSKSSMALLLSLKKLNINNIENKNSCDLNLSKNEKSTVSNNCELNTQKYIDGDNSTNDETFNKQTNDNISLNTNSEIICNQKSSSTSDNSKKRVEESIKEIKKSTFFDLLLNKINKTKSTDDFDDVSNSGNINISEIKTKNKQTENKKKSLSFDFSTAKINMDMINQQPGPSGLTRAQCKQLKSVNYDYSSDSNLSTSSKNDFHGFNENEILMTHPKIPGLLATPIVTNSDSKSAFISIKDEYPSAKVQTRELLPSPSKHNNNNIEDGLVCAGSEIPRLECPERPANMEKPRTVAEKRQLLTKKYDFKFMMIDNESTIFRELKKRSRPTQTINFKLIKHIQNLSIPFRRDSWRATAWLNTETGHFYYRTLTIGYYTVKLIGDRGNFPIKNIIVKPFKKIHIKKKTMGKCYTTCHKKLPDGLKFDLSLLTKIEQETNNKNDDVKNKLNEFDLTLLTPRRRMNLLENTYKSLKPGPLLSKCKNKNQILDDNCYLGPLEIYKMPKVQLELWPKINTEFNDKIKSYLKIIQPSNLITIEWANYALSALGFNNTNDENKEEINNQQQEQQNSSTSTSSFTFDLPFTNQQNKILVRKRLDLSKQQQQQQQQQPETSNDIKEIPCFKQSLTFKKNINPNNQLECEIGDYLTELIDSVTIGLIENKFIQDDPDINYVEENGVDGGDDILIKEKENPDKKTRRKKIKGSRIMSELKKLNATVIQSTIIDPKGKCQEKFCTLGCICASLKIPKIIKVQCRKHDCMFGCTCRRPRSSQLYDIVMDEVLTDEMNILHEKATSRFARVEKEFSSTVVLTNNRTVFITNSQTESKRSKKIPKKLTGYVVKTLDASLNLLNNNSNNSNNSNNNNNNNSTSEKQQISPLKKIQYPEIEKFRHCNVYLQRIPQLDTLETWCMIHCLYKCHCNGQSIDGKPFTFDDDEQKVLTDNKDKDDLVDIETIDTSTYIPMPIRKRNYSFVKEDSNNNNNNRDKKQDDLDNLKEKILSKFLPINRQKYLIKNRCNRPKIMKEIIQNELKRSELKQKLDKRIRGCLNFSSKYKFEWIHENKLNNYLLSESSDNNTSIDVVSPSRRFSLEKFNVSPPPPPPPPSSPSTKQLNETISSLNSSNNSELFPYDKNISSSFSMNTSLPKAVNYQHIKRKSGSNNTTIIPNKQLKLTNNNNDNKNVIKKKIFTPENEQTQYHNIKNNNNKYNLEHQQQSPVPKSQPTTPMSTSSSTTTTTTTTPSTSIPGSPSTSSAIVYRNQIDKLNRLVTSSMTNICVMQRKNTKYVQPPKLHTLNTIRWECLVDAYKEDIVFVWEIKNDLSHQVIIALTITNQMPIIPNAVSIINIKAVKSDHLLLLTKMLNLEVKNENTKNLAVLLFGQTNYWRVLGFIYSSINYLEDGIITKPTPATHPALAEKISMLYQKLFNCEMIEKGNTNEESLNNLIDRKQQHINEMVGCNNVDDVHVIPDDDDDEEFINNNIDMNKTNSKRTIVKSNVEITQIHLNDFKSIFVPIPIFGDHRWFMLSLTKDFSDIYIPTWQSFLKYERIISALKLAKINSKTVKITASLSVDVLPHVYITPTKDDKIFFGPYKCDENVTIVLCQELDGRMLLREEYERTLGIKRTTKTKGCWLYMKGDEIVVNNKKDLTQQQTSTELTTITSSPPEEQRNLSGDVCDAAGCSIERIDLLQEAIIVQQESDRTENHDNVEITFVANKNITLNDQVDEILVKKSETQLPAQLPTPSAKDDNNVECIVIDDDDDDDGDDIIYQNSEKLYVEKNNLNEISKITSSSFEITPASILNDNNNTTTTTSTKSIKAPILTNLLRKSTEECCTFIPLTTATQLKNISTYPMIRDESEIVGPPPLLYSDIHEIHDDDLQSQNVNNTMLQQQKQPPPINEKIQLRNTQLISENKIMSRRRQRVKIVPHLLNDLERINDILSFEAISPPTKSNFNMPKYMTSRKDKKKDKKLGKTAATTATSTATVVKEISKEPTNIPKTTLTDENNSILLESKLLADNLKLAEDCALAEQKVFDKEKALVEKLIAETNTATDTLIATETLFVRSLSVSPKKLITTKLTTPKEIQSTKNMTDEETVHNLNRNNLNVDDESNSKSSMSIETKNVNNIDIELVDMDKFFNETLNQNNSECDEQINDGDDGGDLLFTEQITTHDDDEDDEEGPLTIKKSDIQNMNKFNLIESNLDVTIIPSVSSPLPSIDLDSDITNEANEDQKEITETPTEYLRKFAEDLQTDSSHHDDDKQTAAVTPTTTKSINNECTNGTSEIKTKQKIFNEINIKLKKPFVNDFNNQEAGSSSSSSSSPVLKKSKSEMLKKIVKPQKLKIDDLTIEPIEPILTQSNTENIQYPIKNTIVSKEKLKEMENKLSKYFGDDFTTTDDDNSVQCKTDDDLTQEKQTTTITTRPPQSTSIVENLINTHIKNKIVSGDKLILDEPINVQLDDDVNIILPDETSQDDICQLKTKHNNKQKYPKELITIKINSLKIPSEIVLTNEQFTPVITQTPLIKIPAETTITEKTIVQKKLIAKNNKKINKRKEKSLIENDLIIREVKMCNNLKNNNSSTNKICSTTSTSSTSEIENKSSKSSSSISSTSEIENKSSKSSSSISSTSEIENKSSKSLSTTSTSSGKSLLNNNKKTLEEINEINIDNDDVRDDNCDNNYDKDDSTFITNKSTTITKIQSKNSLNSIIKRKCSVEVENKKQLNDDVMIALKKLKCTVIKVTPSNAVKTTTAAAKEKDKEQFLAKEKEAATEEMKVVSVKEKEVTVEKENVVTTKVKEAEEEKLKERETTKSKEAAAVKANDKNAAKRDKNEDTDTKINEMKNDKNDKVKNETTVKSSKNLLTTSSTSALSSATPANTTTPKVVTNVKIIVPPTSTSSTKELPQNRIEKNISLKDLSSTSVEFLDLPYTLSSVSNKPPIPPSKHLNKFNETTATPPPLPNSSPPTRPRPPTPPIIQKQSDDKIKISTKQTPSITNTETKLIVESVKLPTATTITLENETSTSELLNETAPTTSTPIITAKKKKTKAGTITSRSNSNKTNRLSISIIQQQQQQPEQTDDEIHEIFSDSEMLTDLSLNKNSNLKDNLTNDLIDDDIIILSDDETEQSTSSTLTLNNKLNSSSSTKTVVSNVDVVGGGKRKTQTGYVVCNVKDIGKIPCQITNKYYVLRLPYMKGTLKMDQILNVSNFLSKYVRQYVYAILPNQLCMQWHFTSDANEYNKIRDFKREYLNLNTVITELGLVDLRKNLKKFTCSPGLMFQLYIIQLAWNIVDSADVKHQTGINILQKATKSIKTLQERETKLLFYKKFYATRLEKNKLKFKRLRESTLNLHPPLMEEIKLRFPVIKTKKRSRSLSLAQNASTSSSTSIVDLIVIDDDDDDDNGESSNKKLKSNDSEKDTIKQNSVKSTNSVAITTEMNDNQLFINSNFKDIEEIKD